MNKQDTPARPGLRVHPASTLFEIAVHLRQMIPVLLGSLLASKSDRYAVYFLYAMLFAGLFVVVGALLRALTTRYWIEAEEIVVSEGLLFRRIRHMPFERIQNVVLQQSLMHRPFNLYTVRLEAGGGQQSDADLRVLTQTAARQIEAAVRHRDDSDRPESAPAHEHRLVHLRLSEVLLAGLVLDRGFLIVAAALFGLLQLDLPNFDPRDLIKTVVLWVMQQAGGLNAWSIGLVIAGFLLLTKLLTITLSVAQAALLWYGFRLERDGPRLRAESGLLSRTRASATPDRVQIVSVYDGLWLRLLRRRAVGSSVSGTRDALNGERRLDWLAPIIAEQNVQGLVQCALPSLRMQQLQWRGLHAATHGRLAKRNLALHLVGAIALCFWSWKLLPLLAVSAILGQLHAWAWTRLAGFAFDGEHLAWRSGVTQRITWMVPISRIAGLRIASSPFDRRHGSADLLIDTQAAQSAHSLRLSYLPQSVARELAAVLRSRIEDEHRPS